MRRLSPMTSETVRSRAISLWRTICASPLAPKKMKIAIKARMMLPPRRPTKKKAAKPCPTVEAMSVALRRPTRVVRRPLNTLPPSIGKAGIRLNTARATLMKPR